MGHKIVQVLQAAVLSATAIPIYLWGRRLAGERWALVAAALFLALPVLGYSALIMSEALFSTPHDSRPLGPCPGARDTERWPARRFSGWRSWRWSRPASKRSCSSRSSSRQSSSVGPRRERARTSSLCPSALGTGSAHNRRGLGRARCARRLCGRSRGSYGFGAAARYVAYHAAGVMLLSGIVPALGLTLVCVTALRKREQSDPVRAFVAVAVSYLPWLVLEVGIFASREVGHLAGRDLATAAPITLLGFAIWLSRGGRRPQPATALLACLFTAGLIFLPIRQFAELRVIHDVLELVPLEWVRPDARELVFALVVAVAVLGFTLIRPRPSVVARPADVLDPRVRVGRREQGGRRTVGAPRARPTRRRANVGRRQERRRNGVPLRTRVLVAGRLAASVLEPKHRSGLDDVRRDSPRTAAADSSRRPPRWPAVGADGVVVDAAAVVAPSVLAMRGERVATIHQNGELRAADLGLWRSHGPARLSSYTEGVSAEGDLASSATVTVYDCRRGRLEAALIGKRAGRVSVRLDEDVQRVAPMREGDLWKASVGVTRSAGADTMCVFELRVDGLAGVRRLTFVRGSTASPQPRTAR